MPKRCRHHKRVRWCDRAAFWRRLWVYSSLAATVSSRRRHSLGGISGSSWTSTTCRTWRKLHHRFFFPKPPGFPCQEQQAHQTDRHVGYQSLIAPDFEVVEAHLAFGILDLTFDVPAAKGHVQQHRHRVGVGVIADHHLLHPIPHRPAGPPVQPDELLQRPRRYLRRQGHRLHALALQIADLPADAGPQMPAAGCGADAIRELPQEPVQIPPYAPQLFHVHVLLLQNNTHPCLSKGVIDMNTAKHELFVAL